MFWKFFGSLCCVTLENHFRVVFPWDVGQQNFVDALFVRLFSVLHHLQFHVHQMRGDLKKLYLSCRPQRQEVRVLAVARDLHVFRR